MAPQRPRHDPLLPLRVTYVAPDVTIVQWCAVQRSSTRAFDLQTASYGPVSLPGWPAARLVLSKARADINFRLSNSISLPIYPQWAYRKGGFHCQPQRRI